MAAQRFWYCECKNVTISEIIHSDHDGLSKAEIQKIEFAAGLRLPREARCTVKLQHPSLVSKTEASMESGSRLYSYKCHLCKMPCIVSFEGRKLLTDSLLCEMPSDVGVFGVDCHLQQDWGCSAVSSSDNLSSMDFRDTELAVNLSDLVETEKTRLYEEFQKRVYAFIQAEEAQYNRACDKIDSDLNVLLNAERDVENRPYRTPLETEDLELLMSPDTVKRDASDDLSDLNDLELGGDDAVDSGEELMMHRSSRIFSTQHSLDLQSSSKEEEEDQEFLAAEPTPSPRRPQRPLFPTNIARSVPMDLRPELSASGHSRRSTASCSPTPSPSDEQILEAKQQPEDGRPAQRTIIPPHTYRERERKMLIAQSVPHKFYV